MKNALLALIAILSICSVARADSSGGLTNAQSFKMVVPYQMTCSSTTLGTGITEVSSNTLVSSTTLGISQLKITNQTVGATVCCSHNSTVTCNTGASTDGDGIAPVTSGQKNFLAWGISTVQKWFCTSTAASTGIVLCKVK